MYDYKSIKHEVFTEGNQRLFLGIRDHVHSILNLSGAITMGKATKLPDGVGAADNWEMMAYTDDYDEYIDLKN